MTDARDDANGSVPLTGVLAVRRAIDTAIDLDPTAEKLDDAIGRLAAMPALEYDRVRDLEAKRLGVRMATLDREVSQLRQHRNSGTADSEASSIAFDDPEPWHEPVKGAELVEDLIGQIRRYLVLPSGAAETIALWILHAHLHDTSNISPILAITSPSPECGKTTLLDLLGSLVPRPLASSNITPAALFRAVEKWHPTLLVDEADTFIRNSDELRGVLNSGHRRSAAYVIRTVGDTYEPQQFRTWSPKAIALIGKLPDTLASRSIHIELRRKTAIEVVDTLRGDRLAHIEPLRRKVARFTADNSDQVADADPILPSSLHGRLADNWRHLIAIADVVDGELGLRVRQIASAAAATRSEQTAAIMLLNDLRSLFAETGADQLSSTEIVRALALREDRPWLEWKNGCPITVRQLAKLLEPFKVTPTKFRAAGYTPGTRGYQRTAFTDPFARYLSDEPEEDATTPRAQNSAGSRVTCPPAAERFVADLGARDPNQKKACGVVACGPSEAHLEELFEERAAILEYDGGLSRAEAEARAREAEATREESRFNRLPPSRYGSQQPRATPAIDVVGEVG
jgi:putative DNA primase/helicase